MAFAFTVIYAFSALTKMSPNFYWLLLGRVLGGVSTSILFSTFESWYVYEHSERHAFPADWIGITFSLTTFWNGILAITAGIISNLLAENLGLGPVAPFLAAVAPLIACGFLVVTTWEENYGNRKSHFAGSCVEGLRIIFADTKILLLGMVQVQTSDILILGLFLSFVVPHRVLHVYLCVPVDSSPRYRNHSLGDGLLLLHGLHHGRLVPLHHPFQPWLL